MSKVYNACLQTEIIILHLQVIQKHTRIVPWALLKMLSLRLAIWRQVWVNFQSLYAGHRAPGVSGSHNFWAVSTWRWQACQPYTTAAFTPSPSQEITLVLIFASGWVDPSAIVRLKGSSRWTIQMTPTGNRTRNLLACSATFQPNLKHR
jgi:hypothetical protein